MESILVYLSIIHDGEWNKIYQDILDKKPVDKEEVEKEIKRLECNYITLLSPNYPNSLKNIFKPPFVLFYKGNIDLINDSFKKIAVIGSRENSDYGKESAELICNGLSKKEITIVSGLAKGIDSISHKCSLSNNGNTIAVIGNGLNIVYPKENSSLYKEIEEKGLIISEYPPNVMPNSSNFPKRNRILAGISDGVVVIEAKEKSGTMNTVSHALESGKPIFCIPERNNMHSGCNKLIKEGAKLIETADDIIEEL
jgi:DNA processing protein